MRKTKKMFFQPKRGMRYSICSNHEIPFSLEKYGKESKTMKCKCGRMIDVHVFEPSIKKKKKNKKTKSKCHLFLESLKKKGMTKKVEGKYVFYIP